MEARNAAGDVRAGAFFTRINIDRTSGIPFQRQLYEQLREAIAQGLLEPGSQLPSSRALAAEIGCSRNTVLAVLAQLTAEDYVTSIRGSGVYVVDELPDRAMFASPALHALAPMESAGSATVQEGKDARLGLSRRGQMMYDARIVRRAGTHIAFSPSIPDVSQFPMATWNQIHAAEWRAHGDALVADIDPRGYRPLRQAIGEYVAASRGVECAPEQVIVTSGAQHGIDLVARMLLDRGDCVWLEDPGYSAMRGLFLASGASVVPVPMDAEGIAIDAIRAPSPRLIAVSPSHQFPTGVTMSMARRMALLELADRSGAWILEDDYDSEFRYEGRPIAALAGFGEIARKRVIYVGTFSKMLFPAIRLGYLIVPKDIAIPCARARSVVDLQPSIFAQPALTRFISEGHLAAHVRRMRPIYRQRQHDLIALLEKHASALLHASPDAAGLHITARFTDALAQRYDDRVATDLLTARGISVEPLSHFYARPTRANALLLGYACCDGDALARGVATLVDTLRI